MKNNILKKINHINLKIIFILLYIVLAQLIFHRAEYILINFMELKQNSILYYVYKYGLGIILTLILIALIITLKRFKINKKKETKGMEDIKLKNGNNEFMRCVDIIKGTEENQNIYVLETKNIPLSIIKENKDKLEMIYDIKIDYIEYKNGTTKYVNVYGTPMKYIKPKLFQVNTEDQFMANFQSLLVVGTSGSGKTYYTYQQLVKLILNVSKSKNKNKNENEANFEKVLVFVNDRKNEDFIQFKDCPNYYGINAIDGIRKVHEIFMERLNSGESSEDKPTIICLIEEYAVLLNSLDKKEAEEIKDKVADLLFAGRSKKVIPIVSLQRCDSSYFVRGSREQFKRIAILGNNSPILLDMILGKDLQSQITENNPQGYGYLYEDGNPKLTRFKVGKITEEEKEMFDNVIRSKMC